MFNGFARGVVPFVVRFGVGEGRAFFLAALALVGRAMVAVYPFGGAALASPHRL